MSSANDSPPLPQPSRPSPPPPSSLPADLEALLADPSVSYLLANPDVHDRLTLEASLYAFLKGCWHVLCPETPFVPGRHIEAICLHLEALRDGRIRNAYFSTPPGTTKSKTVSVAFPAWCWTTQPHLQFLCAAGSQDIVLRDSMGCRRLIESEWYQERWGHVFELAGDQNTKGWFTNTKGGHRSTTTVNSSVVGRKGDILLLDDPNDPAQVESAAVCEGVRRWHDHSFFNRVNDPVNGRRGCIGQRTGMMDLAAHIIRRPDPERPGRWLGTYEELRLPEEFDAGNPCETSIGWKDWRTQDGELLRPERFGPEQVEEARRTLGAIGYSAQHQQNPVPREGALFKRSWLRYFRREAGAFRLLLPSGEDRVEPRQGCRWFATMDPAGGTSKHADFTALGVWAITARNDLLLVDVRRERLAVEDIVPWLAGVCEDYPQLLFVAVESLFLNKQLVVEPARRRPGLPPIKGVMPRSTSTSTGKAKSGGGGGLKDKFAHALPAALAMEAGQVWLRAGAPWLGAFEEELLRFTGQNDPRDDQVDILSYGVDEWRAGTLTAGERLETFEGTGFPRRPQHDGFRRDGLAGPMGGGGFPRAPGGGFRRL